MIPAVSNIFASATGNGSKEEFLSLHDTGAVRIERIISHAQASPQDFWYDQADDEWVLLLRGEAALEFEHDGLAELSAGSFLTIPRGVRHRVQRTTEDAVWLAVHVKSES